MSEIRFDEYLNERSNQVFSAKQTKALLMSEFYNLLNNSFTIESTDTTFLLEKYKENFIKKLLIENNKVGFEKITKEFYFVYGEGINKYGLPTDLVFTTANGKTFKRVASYDKNSEGAYIIFCLPYSFPFISIIKKYVNEIVECEISLRQNLKASRTSYIVETNGKNKALSIKHAIRKKEEGESYVLVDSEIKSNMQPIDVSVEFLAPDIYDLKQKMVNDLMSKLGILTTEFKKERVQSAEINGSIDKVIDYTNLFIDNFNQQCKDYDIPLKASINGAIDKLYTDDLDSKVDNNLLDDEGDKDER